MKRVAILYNIAALSIFLAAGLISAKTSHDILISFLFAPPLLYFCRLLIGNLKPQTTLFFPPETDEVTALDSQTSLALQPSSAESQLDAGANPALEPEFITDPNVADVNRRLFLKLIGGAGLSVFMMSIFTDRAHAAFFGSMPVPGALTIKDSTGAAIDPAEKQPTDGYEISEIDDVASPAYYGFVHKTGAWYISREDANGSYRYAKGASDFPSAWTDRAILTYDYFDSVF